MWKKKVRAGVLITGVCWVAGVAPAATIQFDLSGAYNYDGVATSAEVAANVPGVNVLLGAALGDHNIPGNNKAYVNQGSLAVGVGLPDDGVLGPYQLSTAFDNGTDQLTKSDNSIRLTTTNSQSTASYTITLPVGQQVNYESINMAFTAQRGSDSTNYRSWIEVTYTDSSTEIIVDTGPSSPSPGPGGTFGGGGRFIGATNYGGMENPNDTWTFINQAPRGLGDVVGVNRLIASTYILSTASGTSLIRTGTGSMWEFDNNIEVDPTKTLQSITLNLRTSGSNRNHSLTVFAMNGETAAIPEPATLALLGLGGLLMIRRRQVS